MAVEGIDISTWQTQTPSLAGRQFVFARASIGQYQDTRYAEHAAHVRSQGRVLGAYHFVRDEVAAQTQLDVFLGASRAADLWALDIESGDDNATGRGIARSMIAKLQAGGRKVGLYHSLSGYPDLGQDWDWVAYWSSTPPPRHWDFWQYRGSPLDLDRWRGDLASLHAFIGQSGGHDMPAVYQRENRTGTAKLAAGARADGQRIAATGWDFVKPAIGPGTWHFDHRLVELSATSAIDNAYHMTDGPLAGLYVRGGQIAETLDPVPHVPTQADVAAAKAAGYADAKAKAIAAVQTI